LQGKLHLWKKHVKKAASETLLQNHVLHGFCTGIVTVCIPMNPVELVQLQPSRNI
jgi:hypothetical protein